MDFELLELPSSHEPYVARPFESAPSRSASYFDRVEMIERTNCASAREMRSEVTCEVPNAFVKSV